MKLRAVLVVLCLSPSAVADELVLDRTCIEIDPASDGLAADERERATELMRHVLERENLLVVTTGCTEMYWLSHEVASTGYVIRLRSSAGKRRMTTPTLDDATPKYERLTRSLIEAKAESARQPAHPVVPAAQPAAAVVDPFVEPVPTRPPALPNDDEVVTSADPPSRQRRLWYGIVGGAFTGGVGYSVGYRRVHDWISVDIALTGRSTDTGTESSTIGAEVMRNKWLSPTSFAFAGAGLSGGSTSKGGDYGADHYWGKGVHGELSAGLHWGAPRGMQFLAQFDITLPFYRVGNDSGGKAYAPLAVLSGGVGF